ncbi:MAG: hypothetical protein WAT39_11890, partial [Planctomycetota bacterium]
MTRAPDSRRVEALFHAADELPPDGRRAWLEQQCAGDTALLARVLELLHLADEPEVLATPVPAAADPAPPSG